MKKYLFLDIDGVLNATEYYASPEGPAAQLHGKKPTIFEIACAQLCMERIKRLNRLVMDDLSFVLSSAWKRIYPLRETQEMLWSRGFKGVLVGATPTIDGPRGREIATWLELETGVELSRGELAWPSFVILDDRGDMEQLRGRLVQTEMEMGLQDEHITRALKILGVKVPVQAELTF